MEEKRRILIVDDEQDFCALLKDSLEEMGNFEVAFICDPHQTEAMVDAINPELILIDNVMPGRNGADIVKSLRDNPKTKNIHIVMISGRGEMVFSKKTNFFRWLPNTKTVRNRGEIPSERNPDRLSDIYQVDEYISKPVAADTILSVINDIFELE